MKGPTLRKSSGLTGLSRVWLLTAILLPITVLMGWLVWDVQPPAPPIIFPPIVFAVLFYLAEVTVVHVRFRRDAHSFSMSELPLVVALFFLPASDILLTQLAGSALALIANRRQKPVKLVFNLTQLSLQTAVTIAIFTRIVGAGDPLGPLGWSGVALGIAATVVISNTMIGTAIRLSGGRLSSSDRNTMYLLSTGAAVMNAALGLVTATVLWSRPDNAWIATIPSAVLFFAYRAYLAQRLERDRLQALYEASGELHGLPRIEDALGAAADRARAMFDSESAQILLFPDGIEVAGFRTFACADGSAGVMEPAPPLDPESRPATVASHNIPLLTMDEAGDRGIEMAVPIPGSRTVGAIVVSQPLSDIGSFSDRDLRLLETLAGHVGVSLENGRLEDSLARLTELKDQLHQQALHDGLTGLANRTLLRDELTRIIEAPLPRMAAVLFLDLDDFKGVNDIHGHETGDAVLVEVGRRLRSCSRPDDTVARLGGDEFALLLGDLASPDGGVSVAKRIIDVVSAPVEVTGGTVEISTSIGIAMVDGTGTPEDALREADEAMYVAKGEGKGTYRVYSPGMKSQQSHELATVAGLREAIRLEQLELHFQPIYELSTGRIASMEALVRWNHPERGLVSPDEFVPVAERRGVIEELGEWVIRAAADTLSAWSTALPEDPPSIAVNLSASEIARPDLVRTVLDVLGARHLDPGLLQIEITERAVMTSPSNVLEELRRHGVSVALDDFGTGYSSLAYLDSLPVDTIKLAQSFLERISDHRVARLVEVMIGFGETMGFTTIAEGIETDAQLTEIRRLGCELGQGFHLGEPTPPDEALALLIANRSAGSWANVTMLSKAAGG